LLVNFTWVKRGLLSASLGLIEGTGLKDEVNQYEGVSRHYVGKQIVSSLSHSHLVLR